MTQTKYAKIHQITTYQRFEFQRLNATPTTSNRQMLCETGRDSIFDAKGYHVSKRKTIRGVPMTRYNRSKKYHCIYITCHNIDVMCNAWYRTSVKYIDQQSHLHPFDN